MTKANRFPWMICTLVFSLGGCDLWLGLGDFREDVGYDAGLEAGLEVDAEPIDGCQPPTDAEFCAIHDKACGDFEGMDACGLPRQVNCGACLDGTVCDQGTCIASAFGWKTGAWSVCSTPCGGGSRTRPVWCERDDGESVDDSQCPGAKPVSSEACNTHACCTPSCISRDACGDDGCGNSCGTCAADRFCHQGYCVWKHGNDGSVTCVTLCYWGESQCVGTSSGGCGDKIKTDCYCW